MGKRRVRAQEELKASLRRECDVAVELGIGGSVDFPIPTNDLVEEIGRQLLVKRQTSEVPWLTQVAASIRMSVPTQVGSIESCGWLERIEIPGERQWHLCPVNPMGCGESFWLLA